MGFWDSIAGILEIEVTSADPQACLSTICAENIDVKKISMESEVVYSFWIPRSKEKTVRRICEKRGDRVRIRNYIGSFWNLRRGFDRPLLLVGSVLFLLLSLWIPSKVLFVQVEGNDLVPERKILAAAEACGIAIGASRRELRSEQVKNALLASVPELQWAGVNTSGCTAIISVREKPMPEETDTVREISSILSVRDGYVLSSTATAGTLLVRPGDAVRKGQVLISAYTDCGLSIRAERAEGEILGQTTRKLETVMPDQQTVKIETGREKRKYSLLIAKKRIFLWKDSGIWEDSCGRIYKEYYITLPGGYQLPAALCVESYSSCNTSSVEISEDYAKTALRNWSESYLLENMVSGRIRSEIHTLTKERGCYCMCVEYICEEMLGTVRKKWNGDRNGEND